MKVGLENRDEDRIYERDIYRGRPLFFTEKRGFARVPLDAGRWVVLDLVKNTPALALMQLKKS
jgi:hypothetical protein